MGKSSLPRLPRRLDLSFTKLMRTFLGRAGPVLSKRMLSQFLATRFGGAISGRFVRRLAHSQIGGASVPRACLRAQRRVSEAGLRADRWRCASGRPASDKRRRLVQPRARSIIRAPLTPNFREPTRFVQMACQRGSIRSEFCRKSSSVARAEPIGWICR